MNNSKLALSQTKEPEQFPNSLIRCKLWLQMCASMFTVVVALYVHSANKERYMYIFWVTTGKYMYIKNEMQNTQQTDKGL